MREVPPATRETAFVTGGKCLKGNENFAKAETLSSVWVRAASVLAGFYFQARRPR
jgi:hypothetical protein